MHSQTYRPSPQESALAAVLFALCALPAWFRGGSTPTVQVAAVFVAVALLAASWLLGAQAARRHPAGHAPGARWFPWARDPVFYAGALFLLLLALQAWNTGRVLYADPFTGQWRYSDPVHAGWPSSYNRGEALEMLRWFFPAWTILLAFRAGVLHTGAVVRLWRRMSYGAALLAVAGIAQQTTGTAFLYGLDPLKRDGTHFFAGFGYENHAASYFVLLSALPAGLLLREWLTAGMPRRLLRAGLLVASLLLTLAAAHWTGSRAGMILAWALISGGLAYVVIRSWRSLEPAARLNLVLGGAGAVLAVIMLAAGFGWKTVGPELRSLGKTGRDALASPGGPAALLGDRALQVDTALAAWRDHPAFGVGGWGFRYELSIRQAGRAPDGGWLPGRANVHNDPAQFLAEFGAAGSGLMALAVAWTLAPCLRRLKDGKRRVPFAWARPLGFMALLGPALVFAHGLIDLPFRNPAILWAWCGILGGASLLARREHHAATGESGAR